MYKTEMTSNTKLKAGDWLYCRILQSPIKVYGIRHTPKMVVIEWADGNERRKKGYKYELITEEKQQVSEAILTRNANYMLKTLAQTRR